MCTFYTHCRYKRVKSSKKKKRSKLPPFTAVYVNKRLLKCCVSADSRYLTNIRSLRQRLARPACLWVPFFSRTDHHSVLILFQTNRDFSYLCHDGDENDERPAKDGPSFAEIDPGPELALIEDSQGAHDDWPEDCENESEAHPRDDGDEVCTTELT